MAAPGELGGERGDRRQRLVGALAKNQEADFKQFISEQSAKLSTEQASQLFHDFQIWMSKRNQNQ
jgi:hypothetical protein